MLLQQPPSGKAQALAKSSLGSLGALHVMRLLALTNPDIFQTLLAWLCLVLCLCSNVHSILHVAVRTTGPGCLCQKMFVQVICYPVLIVTYLGQAAWLTSYPDQVSSTFYASIPYGDGVYWVRATCMLALFVVSLLSTVWPLLCDLLLLCSNLFCKDHTLYFSMLMDTLKNVLCNPYPPYLCSFALNAVAAEQQLSSGFINSVWTPNPNLGGTQFVFVFATGAACVASQAMISAAFSIIKQSIALGCFPQLSVQHVSYEVPHPSPCAHVWHDFNTIMPRYGYASSCKLSVNVVPCW